MSFLATLHIRLALSTLLSITMSSLVSTPGELGIELSAGLAHFVVFRAVKEYSIQAVQNAASFESSTSNRYMARFNSPEFDEMASNCFSPQLLILRCGNTCR